MPQLKEYTITEIIENSAVKYPNLIALRTWREEGSAITYKALDEKSTNMAAYLLSIGIEKGDNIAILGESCPAWALSYFAINKAGAVAVPILPNFSAHEVKTILEHSESKAVVVNSKHIEKVVGCNVKVFSMEDLEPCTSFVPTEAHRRTLRHRRPKAYDVASLIYTSGTTGTPKGVMLTNKNICFNAEECSTPFIKIHAGWNALSILPLSHVYEFTLGLITLLLNGVQITYLGKAPSTDTLLPALKEVRPHVMMSVPLLIEKIYRRSLMPKLKEGTKLGKFARNPITAPLVYKIIGSKVKKLFGGRLKFFGIGGAAFDNEAQAFFHRIGFPYALGYGLTETAPLIAGCGPKDQVVGTLGPVLDSLSVKLDPGTNEVLVKGPSVMRGYYKNEELTSEVFTEDGYFRTGDVGRYTEDGRLVLNGRIKTMILGPSGENIFPENIEFLINAEDDVLESLVVADEAGRLVSLIRVDMRALKKKGIAVMEYLEKIKSHVNEKLSSFSRIQKVELQETPFERTPSEKIKRYKYQKRA